MFFKNLRVFRLTQALPFDPQAIQDALASKPAREPGSQELSTYGFTAPFAEGEDAPLVHVSGDFLMVCAAKASRILPPAAITSEVKRKIKAIEAEQVRKVYKKERDQLRDEVIQARLPHAFIDRRKTFAMIMPRHDLIVVNASSASTAEDLLSTLREVLGSLPVRPVTVKIAPSATMTDWLRCQKAAPDFYVLSDCQLADPDESGGRVVFKAQDLTSDELQMHLATGKLATNMKLAWQDKLSFVLDDKLGIKSVKFEALLEEQAEADGGEDALGQLDASFHLMGLTFAEFLPALYESLGGEEIPQGLSDSAPINLASTMPVRTGRPERQIDLEEAIAASQAVHDDDIGGEDDPLFAKAVAHVRKSGRASISSVQRALLIGYNRAARMIELMEDTGVITPMNTSGGREVIQ